DVTGEWLCVASANGLLHLLRTDGYSRLEVLPRAWLSGTPLTHVHEVVGTSDGFVVGGVVSGQLVAPHYDLGRRRLRAHRLGLVVGEGVHGWRYDAENHSAVAHLGRIAHAVDLASGGLATSVTGPLGSHRAKAAIDKVLAAPQSDLEVVS